MIFQGCYTALVTPFRDGVVDYAALERLVEEQIAAGVAGVLPVGTTGESPTLTYREHDAVIEFVVRKVDHRIQVIAGTGANSTEEARTLSRHAADVGADATLQVTPYYNKPTPEGLYRHFSEVAEFSGIPAVLYNVPGRTGREIPLDVVQRLAAHPLIGAIKEAAGSVERVNAIRDRCDLPILSGDDSLTLPMMAVGASGVISVASNIIPKDVSLMVSRMLQGDLAGAYAIHRQFYPLFRDLFVESNPSPIKAAMAELKMLREEYRLPMCEMEPANRAKLIASMKRCGLLK